MKSREEFEKSVFAKKDALLKKRRNRIITVASLACTALCLTVAASAIKPLKTADAGGSGKTEVYYDGALPHPETELGIFGEDFREDDEANEKTTYTVETAEGVFEEATTSYPKQFGYAPAGNTEIATEKEEDTHILKYTLTVPYSNPKNPFAGETAIYTYPDGYTEPYFAGGLSSTKPDTAEKKYPSDDEIRAAALSYLTDAEKAMIIDDTPSIAMVHYTDKTKGDEYEIFYRTLTGKIKIVLLVDTLELVEKK